MSPEPIPAERWTFRRYLALSVFWFGLSLHWMALLSMIIPDQVDRYAPPEVRGTWLAVVTGLGAAVSAVVQIVVGYRSDRTTGRRGRRRPYIVAGTVLTLFSLFALGQASSFTTFLCSVLLIQFTTNIANGPYQALIPDLVPRQLHGAASTWMGVFQHLGQAAGPIIAGIVLTKAGLPALTSIIAGILLVLMLLTVAGVKEEPLVTPPAGGSPWEAFQFRLGQHPAFARLLASRLVINLGLYTAIDFMMYYVRYSLGAENYREDTSFLLAFMVVGGLVGAFPAGFAADRFNKVRLIYFTNALTAASAILFVMISTIEQARGVGLILGLGFGAFTVIDWALACNLMPTGESARSMGIWNLTAVLPQILAPVIAGPVTDLVAGAYGPGVAYRVAMASVLLYLVIGTVLLRRLEAHAEPEKDSDR